MGVYPSRIGFPSRGTPLAPVSGVAPPPGDFERSTSLTRMVTVDNLHAHHELSLIDARAETRFRGLEEPIDPVAGHIPGAQCYPFQENLDASGHFLPAAELSRRFGALSKQDVVNYCGSGVTAAHNILAMVHAGLPEPALYPGSWSEWIQDSERPVAR